jgi:hypothetical protein
MRSDILPGHIGVRLFLTVWLVYAAHATSNVVRETYLAVAIGGDYTVRVDPYLGLHPDLFEIAGRGAYINSNPGASLLGAVPYAMVRPAIAALFALKPSLGAPKPAAAYSDPRPNRSRYMNEMRARGLDVRLALAAFAMQFLLMAPVAAAAAWLLFRYLCARYGDERRALWLALLYAFGTPIFFRSAFLNQNALLAHCVLVSWLVLTWPDAPRDRRLRSRRWGIAGLLLGVGLLCDYSAMPLALVFGVWAIWEGWRVAGLGAAMNRWGAYVFGAAGPIMLLLLYQWVAFGRPWYPAQRYMPATEFSTRGWNGMTMPTLDLLWRNLFDPRYGLFVFCPLLLVALSVPAVRRLARTFEPGELMVAFSGFVGLWVFSSANQFANLQWNTGVRYLVPAAPLLFVVLVPALLAMPRWARATVIVPTLLISWSVTMMREDVPTALGLLATQGPTLPMLIVLRKTAASYAPFLGHGLQPYGTLSVLAVGALVVVIWKAFGAEAGLVLSVSRS